MDPWCLIKVIIDLRWKNLDDEDRKTKTPDELDLHLSTLVSFNTSSFNLPFVILRTWMQNVAKDSYAKNIYLKP